MIFMIWSVVLIAVLVLHYRKSFSRFSDNGVKHFRVLPIFGNMIRIILRIDNFSSDLDRIYDNFPEERFVGKYEFLRPILVVRDLELVKKIAIKDFEHFLDHRSFTDDSIEPLFARNLISLKGQEWKDMRSTLSPAFTSSKIRLMVPFMEEVGKQMTSALQKKISESATGSVEIDCKDLTSRYANDVIASCAFGLKVDSHTDENNQFYEMGRMASTFKFKQLLLFFALSACPAVANKLKLTLFSNQTRDFFTDLVARTMRDRETKNIIRPDMIHLLMEAKKGHLSHDEKSSTENGHSGRDAGFATVEESTIGKKTINRGWAFILLFALDCYSTFFIPGETFQKVPLAGWLKMLCGVLPTQNPPIPLALSYNNVAGTRCAFLCNKLLQAAVPLNAWSDIDLTAQATLFFIAGFETISTGMSFAVHELATHPDIQDRLYAEIKENDVKHGGKLDYTSIQNMTYMDMVVSEVLRMWPPGLALDRVCIKDYNMGKPNDKSTKDFIIRKGEAISIPVWCFHHNAEYFPNPEKFDPERFSDENKHLINPMTYMPFGLGPRNCIGSRFALCELKVLLYQILLHFEVSPSAKTRLPAKLSSESFNLRLVGGHWLMFKSRA